MTVKFKIGDRVEKYTTTYKMATYNMNGILSTPSLVLNTFSPRIFGHPQLVPKNKKSKAFGPHGQMVPKND